MYSVTNEYKSKIQELDRTFSIDIRIEHSTGTLRLTDKHIAQGSFKSYDASQAGDEFTVGGTVAKHIEFQLVNKDLYDNVSFIGAKVVPVVGLVIKEGIDAHFLQSTQPSKMPGTDELIEYIPIGQFNIDIADRGRSIITIKAMDNMIHLDKPYSLSKLSYPATLEQIYNNICSVGGVVRGEFGGVNRNYIVDERPEGDLSLRNVLGFVAELSGSFAKFDRNGRLHLKWYEDSGVTLTKKQRSYLELGDEYIQVTGISVETDEVYENNQGEEENIIYLAGTDDYAIDLTGNELLQGNYAEVLPNILTRIGSTLFTPYSASYNGDPALDSGDIITHTTVEGFDVDSIITHVEYMYRGSSTIEAKALPNISRGFSSSDNRVASIINRVEKNVDRKLTTLEQEQLQATELIGGMLGGYVTEIKYEDDAGHDRFGVGMFVHNAPKLANSNKIWKWGIGGFGYSDDGGRTYTTGITAEGSIVAELISANIINANQVNTGVLSSNNGRSHFNLDTGSLKIGHEAGQYSEMTANGFIRRWQYGTAQYLSDIDATYYDYRNVLDTTNFIIDIPYRFRNRNVDVIITPAIIPLDTIYDRDTISIYTGIAVRRGQPQIFTYTSRPYVEVEAFTSRAGYGGGERGLAFWVIVIGK